MTATKLVAGLLPERWAILPQPQAGTYLQALAPCEGPYRSNFTLQPGLAPGVSGPNTVEAIHDLQLRASFVNMTDGVFLDHRAVQAGEYEGLVSTMAFRFETHTLTTMLWSFAASGGVVVATAVCVGERFTDEGRALEELVAVLPFDGLSELPCLL